jgi:hypothetical protein
LTLEGKVLDLVGSRRVSLWDLLTILTVAAGVVGAWPTSSLGVALTVLAILGGVTTGLICAWLLRVVGHSAFQAINARSESRRNRSIELASAMVYFGALVWLFCSGLAGYASTWLIGRIFGYV